MEIDGKFRKEIRVALLDAFPTKGSLEIFVDEFLDVRLQNITLGENMEEVAFDLVVWCCARGRLSDLILGAAEEVPGNRKIQQLANRFPIARGTSGEQERIVLDSAPFQNAGQWLAKFTIARRAISRIEPQPEEVSIEGFASGFLIADDLLMTNHHVIKDLTDTTARSVNVRFDFEVDENGKSPPGRTVRLAEQWLVDSSPDDMLDFAVVRLAEQAGKDRVANEARGYLKLKRHTFTQDEPILILQHPMAKPLKLAIGSVKNPVDGERVTYSANTEGGSSGSPCFDCALDVVALHHCGGLNHNRGVRMSQILTQLESSKVVKLSR
jgi:V8-like Glu-specific endopeptidase